MPFLVNCFHLSFCAGQQTKIVFLELVSCQYMSNGDILLDWVVAQFNFYALEYIIPIISRAGYSWRGGSFGGELLGAKQKNYVGTPQIKIK